MTAGRRYLSFLAVLCLNLPLMGQVVFAQDGNGTNAFRAGDYQTAMLEFQRMRDAGDHSPRLTFNLAVTHYQLGNSAESARLFRELLNEPRWRDLAHFNLGLVALQAGASAEAMRWFQTVERTATDAGLRALASQRISELERDIAVAPPPRSSAMVSAAFGFDSNVIAFPDEFQQDASQGEDTFFDLLGYASGYMSGVQGDGVRMFGFGYTRRHTDLDFLDPIAIGAGVVRERPLGEWLIEYGAGVGHSTVDGEAVTTDFGLRLGVARMFGPTRFTATYRPQVHSAGSAFPELDGTSHRAEFAWQQRGGPMDWRAAYRFEYHDREDREFEDEFFSSSPVRHRLLLEAGWRLAPKFGLQVGGSHELSRYRDANRMTDIDDVLREAKRNTGRTDLWARGEYDITDRLRLGSEVRHITQDDEFVFFEYDRSTISVGLEYAFR